MTEAASFLDSVSYPSPNNTSPTPTSSACTIRILLLGRSGSGKSSSGNTILGRKVFHSPKRHKEPVTKNCKEHNGNVAGRIVSVIDTPDLLNPNLTEDQLQQEKDILLSLCQSGLHAVLLLVPIGEDLQNEQEMLEFAKSLFGKEILNYVILLFTMGEKLEDDETLECYIQSQKNELQALVENCKTRICVFNNMVNEQQQVTELLQTIKDIVISNTEVFKNRQSMDLKIKFSGAEEKIPEFRLVLLGKTGVGKSASGNTILGRNLFQSAVSSVSQTKQCSVQKIKRDGKNISVTDTPGLFDNSLSNEDIIKEILKCLILASPGPHAFLIVINLGRFTPEEKSTVQEIKNLFGQSATKYAMVLFTHKDSLGLTTIEQFLQNADADLQQLVRDCDGRFHSFDNSSQNYSQFTEFLDKLESMVSTNESLFYDDDMFKAIEKEIQSKQKESLDEKIKKRKADSPNMPKTEWQKIYWKLLEESRSEAQKIVFKELCAVAFAKLSGKLRVTDEEKESAITATESKGISRSEAIRLAVKATRKLAVKKVCTTQ